MSSVPYTFANSTGNIPLAYLDANFSNVKSFADTSGTVTTSAQPNITSVGTLSSLTVTGNVTAANFSGNITGNISNAVYAVSAGSSNTVTTAAQPNITSVGTLSSLTVTGNITSVAGIFIGDGSGLTNITGSNITGIVATATSATTSGTVTTAAQPNITSVGTLSSLTVTGNITGGNLSGTSIVGTLTTSAQTNITSVGTLGSLAVTGNITSGNLSGTRGTFTNIVGSLETAAQPNITSVGTLSSLTVTGNTTTTGNISFGSTGYGLLSVDSDGFSVLGSGNSSYGAYLFADDSDTLVGAHPTFGALFITDYVVGNTTNSKGISWKNGTLNFNVFNNGAGNIANVNNIISSTIITEFIKTTPTIVSSLPSAATVGAGSRAFVTDADSVTFGNLLVGGAGNSMPVFSNGTNWYIG